MTKVNFIGFIITLFFIIPFYVSSQPDFRPGFVITNSNDTVYGTIDYRGDLMMGHICRFKDKNDTLTDFSPNDIAAFRFIDSKFYIQPTPAAGQAVTTAPPRTTTFIIRFC